MTCEKHNLHDPIDIPNTCDFLVARMFKQNVSENTDWVELAGDLRQNGIHQEPYRKTTEANITTYVLEL